MKLKFSCWLIILGFLSGCSTPWRDQGLKGPWCAPETRAREYSRTSTTWGLFPPQDETAYACHRWAKKSVISFWNDLDNYFSKCTFMNQWPESNGTVDSTRQHLPPFDLFLVSMQPTVLIGVGKEVSGPGLPSAFSPKKAPFFGSTYFSDSIGVGITLPYHPGAEVVWFAPALDYDLHRLDLKTGGADFTINKKERIKVTVNGRELTTSRQLTGPSR